MTVTFIKIVILILALTGHADKSPALQQPSCTDCHSDLASGSIRHPELESSCEMCHNISIDAHMEGETEGLALADEVPALCYMCHEEPGPDKKIHYPIEEGNCMTCHTPHSSERKGLISNDLSENLCLDCHDLAIPEDDFTHSPVKEGKCTACHNPHFSEFDGILTMSYRDLCLSCHRSLIAGKEYVHSPVGEGECTFCHNSHSSANRALLTEPFPETFYAEASSENFILCFSCHDSELLLSPTTDYATNFREKQENLHFLHIKGQKGRNCFVCHDMHASTLPHILRNSITFGEWTMKVDFIPAENGGTCYSGCHGPKSYSRE